MQSTKAKTPERDRAQLELWSGRLFLWPARGLFVGYAADTGVHAHHAVQIGLARRGTFRLRAGPPAPWKRYRGAIIGPDQPHQLDGGKTELSLLYVDPESEEGRQLQALAAADAFCSLPSTLVADIAEARDTLDHIDDASSLIERILALLTPEHRQRRWLDARVARALEWLRSVPPGPRSAAEVAAHVSLSTGRFAHLFRDNTGVPLRRYLLWLRLVAAVQQMAEGGTLTDAASAAGFADSAHLTRTFQRMFGIAPSVLVQGTRLVRPA